MHSTFCFSRKQDGCLGHCRLAKQDLLAQTLRIKITGVAFPLVQSTPCHSAGQDYQHGPLTPPGQPLNAQTCPPAAPPRGCHQAPASWVIPETLSPHPLLSFLPPSRPCPGLTKPGKLLEGRAGFMHFYIASNAGHSLSSLPSGRCRMMVPKCSLMAVDRREAEERGGGVEKALHRKSRACVSSLHLVPVSYIILRKYLQARSQFPYLVMRGLL